MHFPSPTFPLLAVWALAQLLPGGTTSAEAVVLKGLVETSVLGGILYFVLKNQGSRWENFFKASEARWLSALEHNSTRYQALLERMDRTMQRDSEERGRLLAKLEDLERKKFCIYAPDQETMDA